MNNQFALFDIPHNSYNDDGKSELTININLFYGNDRTLLSNNFITNKTSWEPQKNDKIYFLPGVNIPRIKFKNLALEHNIKTVREPSTATIIVGSKASLYKMTDSMWVYKYSTEDFKSFWESIKHRCDELYVEKVETLLEYYDNEHVLLNYSAGRYVDKYSSVSNDYINFLHVLPEYIETFKELESSTIYDENSVISLLNGEDATEINEDVFNKLSDMLSSKDTDNHVLAMEIIANSKYVESLIYTELLFYKFGNVFYSTHTKNHVNFKSLTSYLNKSNYFTTTIDNIVESLKDKDQFNTKNLDILLNYCHKDILRNGETQYFTIKTISLTEEHLEKLDDNYTYSTQKDYVSKNPIIEEVKEEPVIDESEDLVNFIETTTAKIHLTHEMDSIEEAIVNTMEEIHDQEEEEVLTVNNNTNGNSNIDWF